MDAKLILWLLFVVANAVSVSYKKGFYKKTKGFKPYVAIRFKPFKCLKKIT